MSKPAISVVIPCLNEEHYLGKLLSDLIKQDYQDFEVIVSDSGSSDSTLEVAERFKQHLALTTTEAKTKGPSAARNTGAKKARGEYLLFLDADLRVPPHTLSSLRHYYEEQSGENLLTAWLTADSKHPVDKFFMWLWSAYFALLTKLGQPRPSAGCIFIKKSAHKALKGFVQGIEPVEDTDYGYRAQKIGIKCRFAKGLTLAHSPRRFTKDGRIKYVFRGFLTESYKVFKVKKSAPKVDFGHYKVPATEKNKNNQ